MTIYKNLRGPLTNSALNMFLKFAKIFLIFLLSKISCKIFTGWWRDMEDSDMGGIHE